MEENLAWLVWSRPNGEYRWERVECAFTSEKLAVDEANKLRIDAKGEVHFTVWAVPLHSWPLR